MWQIYKTVNSLNDYADEATAGFYFTDTPFTMLALPVLYLWFVLKAGPEWMKHRKAFNIDKIIYAYNILQVVMNSWLCYKLFNHIFVSSDKITICITYDDAPLRQTEFVWYAYMYLGLKYLDFFDTIFYVLRKKFNQITFLHIFHHMAVAIASWYCFRFQPGGAVVWIGIVNTFVHAVMYSYYQAANVYKGAPWLQRCKKYVTQLQMIQFGFIAICEFILWSDSECKLHLNPYHVEWVATQMVLNFIIMYLFANFYYHNYVKRKTN